jgi:hypothetical protein
MGTAITAVRVLSALLAVRRRALTMTPNDEKFRLAFETVTVSKTALARYYLRSLEMAQKREPNPWFIPNDDRQTINLEHVLPMKPDNSWNNFDQDTAQGPAVERVLFETGRMAPSLYSWTDGTWLAGGLRREPTSLPGVEIAGRP